MAYSMNELLMFVVFIVSYYMPNTFTSYIYMPMAKYEPSSNCVIHNLIS